MIKSDDGTNLYDTLHIHKLVEALDKEYASNQNPSEFTLIKPSRNESDPFLNVSKPTYEMLSVSPIKSPPQHSYEQFKSPEKNLNPEIKARKVEAEPGQDSNFQKFTFTFNPNSPEALSTYR